MPLQTFVINLDGSVARMASAAAQLSAAGLAFQRVPAFDGRGLSPDELPDYDAKAALAYMGRPMRGGEIGCFHSHLRAAQAVVDSGAAMGLVFEDDMQLVPGAAGQFQALADWLATRDDWDLVNLGANRHRIYSPLAQFDTYVLTRAHYFPMMASGMLWRREGAQAFLAAHDRIFAPIDNYFRHWQTRRDRGLAVWPQLVGTNGAESETFSGPGNRSIEGRHPLYGLIKQRRLMTDKLLALRHKYLRAR